MKIPRALVSFVSFCGLLLLAVADSRGAGIVGVATDPGGRVVETFPPSTRGVAQECREVADLDGPACSAAPGTCLDANPVGICIRKGFLFRLILCARANQNEHEGHRFEWSAKTGLPPSLGLRDPASVNTAPDSTSTAYLGGDVEITPDPPVHNGEFFGPTTAPFCGLVTIHADDLCPVTQDHGACSADFPAIFRTMDVPDPLVPLPAITTMSLPDALLDATYDGEIHAAGGIENFLFSVVDGALPTGLSLEADGTFSGKPTETGTFHFTVHVTEDPADPIFVNPAGCSQAPPCPPMTDELELALDVVDALTTTTLPPCPYPSDQCSRPLNPNLAKPKAGDCLFVLKAAVKSEFCCKCPCDVDGNNMIAASDALRCLRSAVGLSAVLACTQCPT